MTTSSSEVLPPFAQPVDGALDLPRAGFDAGQRVGHREAQIVVAVNRHDDVGDPRHPREEGLEDRPEVRRRGDPDGVRDVDHVRAGGDGGGDDLDQVVDVGAHRVLGGELDGAIGVLIRQAPRQLDAGHGHRQDLVLRLAELPLDMDVAGCDEGVDSRPLGLLDRFPSPLDVVGPDPAETADRGSADLGGDLLHRGEVAGGGDREPGLDHVDAEAGELVRDLQLLGARQRRARRLLTIPQRGIEDRDSIGHVLSP